VDVVFSAPFSGAVFSWFEDCLRGDSHRYDTSHPGYYSHAFRGAQQFQSQALASLVMLDDIYLAAGDFRTPLLMRGDATRKRTPADLGVTVGPNFMHDASRLVGSHEDALALAREPELRDLLSSLPQQELWLEIVGAVADALLIGELKRPLVCGTQRRSVINALIGLGVITQEILFADSSPTAGVGSDPVGRGRRIDGVISTYTELAALEFREPTLETIAAIKNDARVRESAEAFQLILAGQGDADIRGELIERLNVARTTRQVRKAGGTILNLSSVGMSVASLFPGPALALGLSALTATGLEKAIGPLTKNATWYEIGPRIKFAEALSHVENSATGLGRSEPNRQTP